MPVRAMVGFTTLLAATVFLVFPSRREYAELAGQGAADTFSVAYLRIAVQAETRDLHLRLAYVRRLSELGDFNRALEAIRPALALSPTDTEVQKVRFDVQLARMRAAPPSSEQRRADAEELTDLLRRMQNVPLEPKRLETLAQVALELQAPSLAADYLLRAARATPARAAPLFAEAGEAFSKVNDGSSAASAYERAAASAALPDQAVAYALRAVQALEAANRVADAAALAARWVDHAENNEAILEAALRLATAADLGLLARDLGRIRLTFPHGDTDTYQQMRRELAAGDIDQAYSLLETLRKKQPQDAVLHRVEARLAEWSGHSDVALNDWLWLLSYGLTPAPVPSQWEPTR